VACIGHSQHRRLFYTGLSNPAWVAPLDKLKAFRPPADTAPGGWPEGEYLARVAGVAPREVLTALRPALSSSHPAVPRVLLDAALCAPVERSDEPLQAVRRWLEPPQRAWFSPEKLVALVRRLAEGTRPGAARRLADAMYRPCPATD
jgi:hypothetical protein